MSEEMGRRTRDLLRHSMWSGAILLSLFFTLSIQVSVAQLPSQSLPVDVVPNISDGSPSSMAFSPDGSLLISGSTSSSISIRDGKYGRFLRSLRFQFFLAISPIDNSVVLSAEGAIQFFSPVTAQRTKVLFDARYPLVSQALLGSFSVDGSRFLSANQDVVALWDVPAGRVVRVFGGGEIRGFSWIALSTDGRFVYAKSTSDSTLRKWDNDGNLIWTISVKDRFDDRRLSISADTKRLMSFSSTNLQVYDSENGQQINSVDVRNWGASLSPDGT